MDIHSGTFLLFVRWCCISPGRAKCNTGEQLNGEYHAAAG